MQRYILCYTEESEIHLPFPMLYFWSFERDIFSDTVKANAKLLGTWVKEDVWGFILSLEIPGQMNYIGSANFSYWQGIRVLHYRHVPAG